MNFSAGFLVQRIVNNSCGYIASIYLVSHFSIVTSMLYMSILSLITCYALIFIYDSIKKDWFLIESFKKSIENKENLSQKSRLVKIIKKRKWFLILWDPTTTVLIYREGSYKWNNIPNIKILGLFVLSSIASNIIWVSLISTGLFLSHLIVKF